ncbi:MAG: MmgE/PrpD family protein [Paracoccaceae bacterium]|nr:MmgE/PrpD family protein [Paracoccaceae bacterium]
MRLHAVRSYPAAARPAVQDQLAWQIACLASDPAPLDAAASDMAVCRLIDNMAVAVASLNRPPVSAARAQALCHPRAGGAPVIGAAPDQLVDCSWAAFANATAVRELDFHDSFFALDSSHPGDAIMPILSVAQQTGMSGAAFLRGVLVAYQVQTALVQGIPLQRHRIDHMAHLGPAVAAGLGAMLGLTPSVIYEAVNLAAHLSLATRQIRKGRISSWKASAPGHIGASAILAVDRAMRGETAPAPIWEGDYGILAVLLNDHAGHVPLPEPGTPCTAILETFPKAHSAGYHGQAIIDLALRLRGRLPNLDQIDSIVLRTKRMTHVVMGSGSGDPDKWDPNASRETLDHSAPFQFARALVDGFWDHDRSYDPVTIADPDFVALWAKVQTADDPEWNARFDDRGPLDKDHGAAAVITLRDGQIITQELAVADAHPRGHAPWGPAEYEAKFRTLSKDILSDAEINRFLAQARATAHLSAGGLMGLTVSASPGLLSQGRAGLFDL